MRIQVIDNTQNHECYRCLGTGFAIGKGISREKAMKEHCFTCKGTGIWKEEHYYLICHDYKIAFDIDSPGK